LSRLPTLILRILSLLPLRALHALGTVLGWITYGMSPTYRRHLRAHLAQAGYAEPRVRRAAIAAAGHMIVETPAIWFRPQRDVAALVREVSGLDAVLAARAQGKEIVFLAPHLGCFEITVQYTSLQLPITALYRPPKMRWLDPLMREGRGRPTIHLVPADLKGVRQLYRALKSGEAVGLLPDQVPGKGEGEPAEFFGRPAYTMTLAMRLVERGNAVCFFAFARRLPRGGGYVLTFRPLPEMLPGETSTRRMNRGIEALIRECPEQYLWGYNRYKGIPA
jgi:KDO2-lipid IV(A) lauroyltransferase